MEAGTALGFGAGASLEPLGRRGAGRPLLLVLGDDAPWNGRRQGGSRESRALESSERKMEGE